MLSWLLERLQELHQWLLTLDRPFAFLLALPFLVAAAAFVGELVRQRRARLPRARIRANGDAK